MHFWVCKFTFIRIQKKRKKVVWTIYLILYTTGCPIFYQVSFRGTFRVVLMSFETCPKLYLVVRWINLIIWDKKKVEVFCPILIRWIWDPYCENFFNMVMTKKKGFFSHLGLNFTWANQIWEKTNFGFECPILIRWIL